MQIFEYKPVAFSLAKFVLCEVLLLVRFGQGDFLNHPERFYEEIKQAYNSGLNTVEPWYTATF